MNRFSDLVGISFDGVAPDPMAALRREEATRKRKENTDMADVTINAKGNVARTPEEIMTDQAREVDGIRPGRFTAWGDEGLGFDGDTPTPEDAAQNENENRLTNNDAGDQARDDHGRFASGGGGGESVSKGEALTEPKRAWTDTRVVGSADETHQEHFDKHPDEGGKPTQERASEVHAPIINEHLEGKKTAAELGQKPTAILTMGGPASGKGVVLGRMKAAGLDTSKFVHVDPDAVKAALPEYKVSVPSEDAVKAGTAGPTYKGAAAQVHEESSYVAKQIRDKAIEAGHHIVIDGTGGNAKTFTALIDHLESKGYDVHVHHPVLPVDTAVQRAAGRAEQEGRAVPEHVIRGTYSKIDAARDQIYEKAKNLTVYNALEKNPGDRGSSHTVVMQKNGGKLAIHDSKFVAQYLKK